MDPSKRRTLIAIGALAAGYTAIRFAPSLFPEKLSFVELERPSGFRLFSAGKSSIGNFDPFIGLQREESASKRDAKKRADARVQNNICDALYAGLDLGKGQVPLASFSDYYCPLCRVQTKRLAEYIKQNDDLVAVAWHELPIFGENSHAAAKAALAAKRQGKYAEFHAKLMKTSFVASDDYLRMISRDLGLNEAQFFSDVNSKAVVRELENSAALSRVFAFVGTPALVIGRTVVQGQISDKKLRKIIALEKKEGRFESCLL